MKKGVTLFFDLGGETAEINHEYPVEVDGVLRTQYSGEFRDAAGRRHLLDVQEHRAWIDGVPAWVEND